MTGYRVSPEGVEATLRTVQDRAQSLSTTLGGLEGHVTKAVTGAGESPIIAEALGTFFNGRVETLRSIGTRIEAGMTGAVQAVASYDRADDEMAQTQTSLASRATTSGGFSGTTKG
ncbi:DUF6507 family protein [Promicromonospora sp. NPDC023805]|uniref:DUF6507 family protein n=1 Tax=Promicromonospora sp. NPDC023805 TaxID=3154696 RepID=UPI00340E97F5